MIKTTPLSLAAYKDLIAKLLEKEGNSTTPYYDTAPGNHLVTIGRGFNIEGDIHRCD